MDAAPRLSGFDSARNSGGDGASACPIDLVHLARQTQGDSALEAELLTLFDRQAGQIAALLWRADSDFGAVSRGDSVSLADAAAQVGSVSMTDAASRVGLAHKLKGSARAIGAHEVAAAAENYEHCVGKGILRASDAQRLIEAVARVRAALRDLAG